MSLVGYGWYKMLSETGGNWEKSQTKMIEAVACLHFPSIKVKHFWPIPKLGSITRYFVLSNANCNWIILLLLRLLHLLPLIGKFKSLWNVFPLILNVLVPKYEKVQHMSVKSCFKESLRKFFTWTSLSVNYHKMLLIFTFMTMLIDYNACTFFSFTYLVHVFVFIIEKFMCH